MLNESLQQLIKWGTFIIKHLRTKKASDIMPYHNEHITFKFLNTFSEWNKCFLHGSALHSYWFKVKESYNSDKMIQKSTVIGS